MVADEESLFYGSTSMIEPEILFAIGRTKESELNEMSNSQNSNNATNSAKPESFLTSVLENLNHLS